MSTYQYIVPLVYTPETNETLIAKKVIRVLDCTNNLTNDALCDMWNYSHCPSDSDYCQPFVQGDRIFLQKRKIRRRIEPNQNSTLIDLSIATAYDVATNEPITGTPNPYFENQFGGLDNQENSYTNIIVNTSEFDHVDCFYIKLEVFHCRIYKDDLPAFNSCVQDLVDQGKTEEQAQAICLQSYCEPDVMYSEPYCKVSCEDTILIEGVYPNKDCDGNYYGQFVNDPYVNNFRWRVRVYGEVSKTQYDIAEVVINDTKRKSTTNIRTYTMYTDPIPEYVADQIANAFGGEYVLIDYIPYDRAISLTKNNEEGNMWIIKTVLTQRCAEVNFTCNT